MGQFGSNFLKSSAAIILAITFVTFSIRLIAAEPHYQGKSLSDWLAQVQFTTGGVEWNGADAALRSLGSNAIPFLITSAKREPTDSATVDIRARSIVAFRLLSPHASRIQTEIESLAASEDASVREIARRILKEMNFGARLETQGGSPLKWLTTLTIDDKSVHLEIYDDPDGAALNIRVGQRASNNMPPVQAQAWLRTTDNDIHAAPPSEGHSIGRLGWLSKRFGFLFSQTEVRNVKQVIIAVDGKTNTFEMSGAGFSLKNDSGQSP